jgi:hypothetical protein
MPSKQKINRERVQAALNTLCPKCGYSIPPAEIRRVDFDTMVCPKFDESFRAAHPCKERKDGAPSVERCTQ